MIIISSCAFVQYEQSGAAAVSSSTVSVLSSSQSGLTDSSITLQLVENQFSKIHKILLELENETSSEKIRHLASNAVQSIDFCMGILFYSNEYFINTIINPFMSFLQKDRKNILNNLYTISKKVNSLLNKNRFENKNIIAPCYDRLEKMIGGAKAAILTVDTKHISEIVCKSVNQGFDKKGASIEEVDANNQPVDQSNNNYSFVSFVNSNSALILPCKRTAVYKNRPSVVLMEIEYQDINKYEINKNNLEILFLSLYSNVKDHKDIDILFTSLSEAVNFISSNTQENIFKCAARGEFIHILAQKFVCMKLDDLLYKNFQECGFLLDFAKQDFKLSVSINTIANILEALNRSLEYLQQGKLNTIAFLGKVVYGLHEVFKKTKPNMSFNTFLADNLFVIAKNILKELPERMIVSHFSGKGLMQNLITIQQTLIISLSRSVLIGMNMLGIYRHNSQDNYTIQEKVHAGLFYNEIEQGCSVQRPVNTLIKFFHLDEITGPDYNNI